MGEIFHPQNTRVMITGIIKDATNASRPRWSWDIQCLTAWTVISIGTSKMDRCIYQLDAKWEVMIPLSRLVLHMPDGVEKSHDVGNDSNHNNAHSCNIGPFPQVFDRLVSQEEGKRNENCKSGDAVPSFPALRSFAGWSELKTLSGGSLAGAAHLWSHKAVVSCVVLADSVLQHIVQKVSNGRQDHNHQTMVFKFSLVSCFLMRPEVPWPKISYCTPCKQPWSHEKSEHVSLLATCCSSLEFGRSELWWEKCCTKPDPPCYTWVSYQLFR